MYKHLSGMIYTEGVRQFAKEAGAYWLIDAIASYQFRGHACYDEPFQSWSLHVADNVAELLCTDGDKGPGPVELARQTIPYTDFPTQGVTRFFLEHGSIDGINQHFVLMLPSER
ncbi:MAG: hypothetical protein GY774_39990 [Planctomycetes bacterium]|nr:hypothetical protein [Planctomycetota bacterium]